MLRLAEPHGGLLVERVVSQEDAPALRERAARLPRVTLDDREVVDLDIVATGAASPLTGFMGLRDYKSVLERLRLANGTPWPVPFTVAVTIGQMASVLRVGAAALHDRRGELRAIISVTDAFVRRADDEAEAMYGTADPAHPGVRYLLSRPSGVIGGPVAAMPASKSDAEQRSMPPRESPQIARHFSGPGDEAPVAVLTDGVTPPRTHGADRSSLLTDRGNCRRAAPRRNG